MAKTTKRRRDPLEPIDAIPEVLSNRQRPQRKRRNRSWDAKRSKATYDLPEDVIQWIRDVAVEMGQDYDAKVRVGDVARLMLEFARERYEAGELDERIKKRLKPVKLVLFDD